MWTELLAYASLAASAFVSATLLPFGSELVLLGLLQQGYSALLLWLLATLFNTLGSVLNWYLGGKLSLFQHKSWFPFTAGQMQRASAQFQRYGQLSLLFAWLPLLGDPLTLIAGTLGTRLRWFLLLVACGKGLRYAALIWLFPLEFS